MRSSNELEAWVRCLSYGTPTGRVLCIRCPRLFSWPIFSVPLGSPATWWWCLLVWFSLTSLSIAAPPHEATIGDRVAPLYRRDIEPLAAANCAASGCHGGVRPGVAEASTAGLSAYPLWLQHDPHARSWKTLCSDESVTMMSRLGIIENGRIVDAAGFDNCLACHNSYRLDSSSTGRRRSVHTADLLPPPTASSPRFAEGVGCAACHGPAERWIDQHYGARWDRDTAISDGYVRNDDLLTRARMCASCHVGDRDRDMNHDLIAAGHPVLRFEMASHHARLPKHWRDAAAADPARFEAELWTAGAIATADAWLALQQGRVSQCTPVSTWPELAAHDCSSCHQSIRLNSTRRPLSDPGRRGAAKMAAWDITPLRLLLAGSDPNVTAETEATVDAGLDDLQRLLETMPTSDRDAVLTTVAKVRQSLASAHADGLGLVRPPRLVERAIRSAERRDPVGSWEAAAQFYLLLAASRYEWSPSRSSELGRVTDGDGDVWSQADRLRLGLALPTELDSPRFSLSRPLGPELTQGEAGRLIRQILAGLQSTEGGVADRLESAPRRIAPLSDARPIAPSPAASDAAGASQTFDTSHVRIR